jgi:ketosteroid isomerase-like protein
MEHSVIRLSIKLSATLVILSVGVLWGVQASGKEWSATQKEIWEMEKAYWKFWRQRDLDGFMELHHKDYVGWTFPAEPPFNSEEPVNKASYRDLVRSKIGKVSHSDLDTFEGIKRLEVKIFGNVAIAYYFCKVTHGRGRPMMYDYSIRVTHIWMKQNEKWKIIGGMTAR